MSEDFEFTTNAEIAAWQAGDKMGYFVGYVVQFKGKEKATNGGMVAKTIYSNAENTQVQVVAWGDKFIKKLKEFSDLNDVVEIDGALVRDLTNLWKFNSGNTSFELRIGDQTTLRKLGTYAATKINPEAALMPLEDLTKFGGLVKITGTILNPFRLIHAKDKHYGIGSIAAGGYKLEVKINNFADTGDAENLYDSGKAVEIKGCLKKRNMPNSKILCPSFFEVDSENAVKITDTAIKIDADFFLATYKYVK